MKKFYAVCLAALFCFVQGVTAQTHNAIFSGNWSDNSIWGPSGPPPNNCNNCTTTINDGVDVTLDISFTMLGTSKVLIGSSGATASSLTITGTTAVNIAGGHNFILSNQAGGNPTVKIVSALSSLRVTISGPTVGKYDGVFTQNLPDLAYSKIVGIKPNLIGSDSTTVSQNLPPFYSTSLPNAANPAPFTLNSDGTLPVSLTSFNAVLNGDKVNLSWTTAQEINAGYFGVQHSNDGASWQDIGVVYAKGFSSTAVNYSYADESPSSNANYYRLLVMDRDGRYKYSPIKVVNGTSTKGLSVFPNPANNFVNVTLGIDMSTNTTIRLLNQFGQILQERKLTRAAGTTQTLPVQNYPQGNYILQITGENGSIETRKVLISR
ncbi:MAG: T9SS type A sorting domain-containing protein [Bacteroidetes bacterium]|nr:T9SS type A sorting domain-containing protein [Bacteroidota bacterium]